MENSIKLECTNCRLEKELPDNISLARLETEAKSFWKEHKTRIGNMYCKYGNLFVRTFKL